MAKCKKCDTKLNFRNNFGGICEECYDKIRGGIKGLNNGDVGVCKVNPHR